MKKFNAFIIVLSSLMILSCADQSSKSMMTSKGFKYEVVEKTDGREIAPGDIVQLVLKATADNGDVVQEATKANNPAVLQLPDKSNPAYSSTPIPEVVDTSTVGDSLLIYLPIDSIPSLPPEMQDYQYIRYEIRILNAMSKDEFSSANETAENEVKDLVDVHIGDYVAGKLDLNETDSGLKYFVHHEGNGPKVNAGEIAVVHYYGALTDGKSFDNSLKRGQPFTFPVGQGRVIQGWDEGLALLNVGDKATFFIPSELGYGKAGAGADIPGDSELVFYVEVLDAVATPAQ